MFGKTKHLFNELIDIGDTALNLGTDILRELQAIRKLLERFDPLRHDSPLPPVESDIETPPRRGRR